MKNHATAFFAVAVLICLIPAASHALTPYSQDFEGLSRQKASSLADDGWWVFGNVFTPDGGTYIRGYGPYEAPNSNAAFCQIVNGEGGVDQGSQQLVVFSDYENTADHTAGNIVESNVFQEQVVVTDDVGDTWVFDFQAKMGNLELNSTALAFIKTLDPDAGYDMTNFITVDMTSIPATWSDYSLSIEIDSGLDGQILQFGFLNTATNYEGSGIFYDNVDFHVMDPVAVDEMSWGGVKSLYR